MLGSAYLPGTRILCCMHLNVQEAGVNLGSFLEICHCPVCGMMDSQSNKWRLAPLNHFCSLPAPCLLSLHVW